jgi:hypothetical protein
LNGLLKTLRINDQELKNIIKMKTVSIISIIYGTFGFMWALLLLFAIGMQKAIMSEIPVPDEALKYIDIPLVMDTLHGILNLMVPFVFLIGLIYIISGILGLNDKAQASTFGMLAAVFNIVWYVAYIVLLQIELVPLIKIDGLFPSKLFSYLILLGTLVNAIFYCAYPVFLVIYLSQRKGGKREA